MRAKRVRKPLLLIWSSICLQCQIAKCDREYSVCILIIFLKSIDIVCITATGRFTLSVCRMRLIFVARLQPSEAESTAYMYAVMRCLSVRLSCCLSRLCIILQELSYRQQIARQLRTQYAEGIYRHKYYTVTLKSRLRVTQGHWKRNHWVDHTRLSSSRVIWRWILLWPWNVG